MNNAKDEAGVIAHDEKQASLFQTMAAINHRYGKDTLRIAGAHIAGQNKRNMRFMYPMISAF